MIYSWWEKPPEPKKRQNVDVESLIGLQEIEADQNDLVKDD